MQLDVDKTKYLGICDICFRRFYSFKKLVKHWEKMHPNVISIKCCFCKHITNEDSFAKHKDDFHRQLRMACEFCFYTTRRWHRLKKHHTKIHFAVEKETVSFLKMEFKTSDQQNTNVIPVLFYMEHHCLKTEETEQLEIVGKVKNETNVDPLKSDLMKSVVEPLCGCKDTIHCDICKLDNVKKPPAEDVFVCDVCQQCFLSASHLSHHTLVHSTLVRCYICKLCDKWFNEPKDYDQHIKIHFKLNPFKCTQCEKTYATKGGLVVHTRTHTGDLRYKCHLCNYASNQPTCLNNHLRVHSNERPFKCTVCEYSGHCHSAIIHHTRMHTGEKPFCCDVCGRKFSIRRDLTNHKKRVHLA